MPKKSSPEYQIWVVEELRKTKGWVPVAFTGIHETLRAFGDIDEAGKDRDFIAKSFPKGKFRCRRYVPRDKD